MVAQAMNSSEHETAFAKAVVQFLQSDGDRSRPSTVGVTTLAEYLRERRTNRKRAADDRRNP